MTSKRKQEEKHLNLLRGIAKLEDNRFCFECHQKGPTYIDMTIGAFVCTACSGLLCVVFFLNPIMIKHSFYNTNNHDRLKRSLKQG